MFGPAPAKENKYTVATLSSLHQQLSRVNVVTDRNKAMVVESLRTIAELIIWGDKCADNFPHLYVLSEYIDIVLCSGSYVVS